MSAAGCRRPGRSAGGWAGGRTGLDSAGQASATPRLGFLGPGARGQAPRGHPACPCRQRSSAGSGGPSLGPGVSLGGASAGDPFWPLSSPPPAAALPLSWSWWPPLGRWSCRWVEAMLSGEMWPAGRPEWKRKQGEAPRLFPRATWVRPRCWLDVPASCACVNSPT